MAKKVVSFQDFKNKVELEELKKLKGSFTKNDSEIHQVPGNSKYKYNDITKKMDDLPIDMVDDSIESLEDEVNKKEKQ